MMIEYRYVITTTFPHEELWHLDQELTQRTLEAAIGYGLAASNFQKLMKVELRPMRMRLRDRQIDDLPRTKEE